MTRETAKQVGLSIARRMEGMREIRRVLERPSILIEPTDARLVWPMTYRQKVHMVANIARHYRIQAPPVYPSPHDWPEPEPRLPLYSGDPRPEYKPEVQVRVNLQLTVEFQEQLQRLSQMIPGRRP